MSCRFGCRGLSRQFSRLTTTAILAATCTLLTGCGEWPAAPTAAPQTTVTFVPVGYLPAGATGSLPHGVMPPGVMPSGYAPQQAWNPSASSHGWANQPPAGFPSEAYTVGLAQAYRLPTQATESLVQGMSQIEPTSGTDQANAFDTARRLSAAQHPVQHSIVYAEAESARNPEPNNPVRGTWSAAQPSHTAPQSLQPSQSPQRVKPASALAPNFSPQQLIQANMMQPLVHTPQLDSELRQQLRRIDQVMSLMQRGALYAARREAEDVLRQVIQLLDAQAQGTPYVEALHSALRAMQEAEDFAEPPGGFDSPREALAQAVAKHRTPVLKEVELESLNAAMMAQAYYAYAVDSLVACSRSDQSASWAMYALGRIYGALADDPHCTLVATRAKSTVLHHAALIIYPRNHLAANELAVNSARQGQLLQAKSLLVQSLTAASQPAAWYNLAKVHQRLGEATLANQAYQAASQVAGGIDPANPQQRFAQEGVRWLSASEFAATSVPPAVAGSHATQLVAPMPSGTVAPLTMAAPIVPAAAYSPPGYGGPAGQMTSTGQPAVAQAYHTTGFPAGHTAAAEQPSKLRRWLPFTSESVWRLGSDGDSAGGPGPAAQGYAAQGYAVWPYQNQYVSPAPAVVPPHSGASPSAAPSYFAPPATGSRAGRWNR